MQKNATAYSLFLSLFLSIHFFFGSKLEVATAKADGEAQMEKMVHCRSVAISNVLGLISLRFFASSIQRTTAKRHKYIFTMGARVEDNKIRRQISGNLHLMATAFLFSGYFSFIFRLRFCYSIDVILHSKHIQYTHNTKCAARLDPGPRKKLFRFYSVPFFSLTSCSFKWVHETEIAMLQRLQDEREPNAKCQLCRGKAYAF